MQTKESQYVCVGVGGTGGRLPRMRVEMWAGGTPVGPCKPFWGLHPHPLYSERPVEGFKPENVRIRVQF